MYSVLVGEYYEMENAKVIQIEAPNKEYAIIGAILADSSSTAHWSTFEEFERLVKPSKAHKSKVKLKIKKKK